MNQPPAGSRRPSGSTIIAGILIAIVTAITILGAFTALQPHSPVTEQAKNTRLLYEGTLIISLIVFLLVTNGIIWAVIRYRRKDDQLPEQIHGSNILEFTWTIIPILILVGLFIPSTILVLDLKTPPNDDDVYMTVEAVGHQWFWEFIYPDGTHVQQTPPNYSDFEPPHLVVPVDKTIVVKVRSTDVVHSFYAPHTSYKVQAIPGTVNQMHFKVTEVGEFYGQCYQFCGVRHSDMKFILDARTEADFNDWLKSQPKAPATGAAAEQAPSQQPVSSTEGQ